MFFMGAIDVSKLSKEQFNALIKRLDVAIRVDGLEEHTRADLVPEGGFVLAGGPEALMKEALKEPETPVDPKTLS